MIYLQKKERVLKNNLGKSNYLDIKKDSGYLVKIYENFH